MKYVSIDIETTGLDPETCDVLEFGAVLDDLENPKAIEDLPKWHCYFVKEAYMGQPYALSMHPHIFRRIATKEEGYHYHRPMGFAYMFKKFLLENGYEMQEDRVYINAAGKNFAAFDLPFLERKTDLKKHIKIRHRILDPSSMYLRIGDEALPGTEECLKRANLDSTVAHTAIEDAIAVIKLIRYNIMGHMGL